MPVPGPQDHIDESALNAAAAREVSRELDALNFSPPQTERAHSPLIAPTPPFAQNAGNIRGDVSTDSLPSAPISPQSPIGPGSPNSPPGGSLPPPKINLPNRSVTSLSSTTGGTPYRTPMESPLRTPTDSPYRPPLSNLSTGPAPGNRSSVSPNSPPLPPGTRTISAAAFKRQPPRAANETGSPGPADITPLAFKKRSLPSSPYPARLQATREPSGQSPKDSSVPTSPVDGIHRRVPSSVPQNTFPDEDDQFDYITAYVNNMGPEEGEAPHNEESGKKTNGAGGPTSSGYGQGRFATNLEDSGLR